MKSKWTSRASVVLAVLMAVLVGVFVGVLPGVGPVVSAEAAAYTNSVGGHGWPANANGKTFDVTHTLDLSVQGLASNDTVELVNIASNSLVVAVTWECVAVTTNHFTFDLGDSGSSTRYFTLAGGISNSLAAQTLATNATYLATGSVTRVTHVLYTANDALKLRSASAARVDTGKIRVRIMGWDLSQ